MSDQKKLSVYTNDDEWVIAYSETDAAEVYREFCGTRAMQMDEASWELCRDENEFTFHGEDGDRKQSFATWAQEKGRGYFASVDY